jgi:hypothetical protein
MEMYKAQYLLRYCGLLIFSILLVPVIMGDIYIIIVLPFPCHIILL